MSRTVRVPELCLALLLTHVFRERNTLVWKGPYAFDPPRSIASSRFASLAVYRFRRAAAIVGVVDSGSTSHMLAAPTLGRAGKCR
jgi:hypothetical protein